jgi:hypothetical protein
MHSTCPTHLILYWYLGKSYKLYSSSMPRVLLLVPETKRHTHLRQQKDNHKKKLCGLSLWVTRATAACRRS